MKKLFGSRRPPEQTAIGIGPPDGSFDDPPVAGWQILEADMAARMYRNDMQLLFNFGAGGAIRGLKSTMAGFERQGQTGRNSVKRIVGGSAHLLLQPIEQELYNLLTLSVQGHFEKAFRRWLRNSLEFVDQCQITDEDIIRAQWSNPSKPTRDLGAIMQLLRGVHLNDVSEGPALIELALIGNVVRHGDGPSARQAYERYPTLFDPAISCDELPEIEFDDELPERLRVNEVQLASYAQAVFQFWHRVQFAYTGEH